MQNLKENQHRHLLTFRFLRIVKQNNETPSAHGALNEKLVMWWALEMGVEYLFLMRNLGFLITIFVYCIKLWSQVRKKPTIDKYIQ